MAWEKIEDKDFSKDGMYSIDTRDFYIGFVDIDELPDSSPIYLKHKFKYSHKLEDVIEQLKRLREESGGSDEDSWRYLNLIGYKSPSGWLKYIRFIKTGDVVRVFEYSNDKIYELHSTDLKRVVDKEFLNYHVL